MDPDQSLRARCLDMALRAVTANSREMLDLASAMERFIKTGSSAKPEIIPLDVASPEFVADVPHCCVALTAMQAASRFPK